MKKNLIVWSLLLSGAGIPLQGMAELHMNAYPKAQVLTSQVPESEGTDPGMTIRKKELKDFQKKYKLAEPKASPSEVEAAQMQVELYQLERENDTIVTGASLLDKKKITLQQGRDIAKTVRALASAALQQGGGAKKELYLFLDYLFTENIIESIPKYQYSNYADVRKVPADFMSALSVCDDRRKGRLIAAVQSLLEAEQLHLTAEKIKLQVNSDYIYNVIPHLFLCAIHNPDEAKAINDLKAFSHFLSACTQYSPGGMDILKPDGTGFHHKTHYNGYMYSYRTWVDYMGRLKGTSFRIEKDAYYRMRKAVISVFLMAVRSESDRNRFFANSMAGRHPFTGLDVNFPQESFKTLLEVGGDILGMPYDKELASYYNYFYKTRKYADAPELNADGFYQFNYSPAGVYRHDNWVAVMRCPTTNFWGGELYNKTNRFGRYQSHGTLEILYEGGLSKTGYPADKEKKGAGWDWNMMPGSTTVHYTDWKAMMPNKNDADRFDQKSVTTNFAGALSWKDCGLFAAAFDQGDNWGSRRFEPTNLSFCKSVFAIDGMLFSLGTGISAKGTYSDEWLTATNLFQSMMSKDCKGLVVNGKNVKKGDKLTITSQQAAWMVAPTTTGYFIPKGHDELVISYDEQTTPSSVGMAEASANELAGKAYLNHGVKPEKKGYQFLVVPATTSDRMQELAKKQEKEELFKTVLVKDSLHIVKHMPTSTTAYAIFAPTSGLNYGAICSSNSELLVMERADKAGKELQLAICNPNLRPEVIDKNNWKPTPTQLELELKGGWTVKADSENKDILLEKNGKGNTVLKTLLSEGNPVYVFLIRKK